MEGAQHAGNVADRGFLDAPFRKGSCGLSLEIDDDVVFSGVQHLAQMKVAVNTRSFCGDFSRQYCSKAAHHFALKVENLQCFVEHNTSQCLQVFLQYLEHLP